MTERTPSLGSPNRLFIVTGDHSGDIHAAKVARALKKMDPAFEIHAVGDRELWAAGAILLEDQSRMNRVGLGAFTGIPYHYQLGKKIVKHLETFSPGAVLLVDYGGFNLRLAAHLKKLGHRVFYFITPQVWGSRQGRIAKIKASVDRVFCIFPFEEDLYRQHGVPVTYVGHPLIGELPPPTSKEEFCRQNGLDPAKKIIALFPGSRKMEIDYLLGPILSSLRPIREGCGEEVQFVLAKAASLREDYFQNRLARASQALAGVPVKVVERQNHALLSVANLAIAASGTTTLEAALYGTPMVVAYKGPWLAYQIYKKVRYLPCLSLPNILTDVNNPIVPELLQYDVTPPKITEMAIRLLTPESLELIRAKRGFEEIHQKLSGHGLAGRSAGERVALGILRELGIPEPSLTEEVSNTR